MANRQNTLLLKRSNIIGKIPPLSGLTLGEMALNTADAKLYTLFTSGTTGAVEVRQIGWDRIHRTGDTVTGNLTVSGTTFLNGLSATTISATTIGTSGDCIDDIYVSNIHSCSPLNINPLNEGNVYFGSTSGVTIDLSNNRVGIGNITPSEKLDVSGKTKTTNLQVTANATPGYVLTAIDSSGNARWEAVGSDSNDLDPVLTIASTTASTVSVGDRFLISGATISIWSGRTNQIAEYTGAGPTDYSYLIPATDDVVFVTDTLTTYRFNGTDWIAWRGVAILQNGNTLTTPVNIGTNNNQNLTFRTSGQTRVTIDTSGSTTLFGRTTLVQPQGSDYLVFSSSTLANSGQTMYIRQTGSGVYVFGATSLGGTFMQVGPGNRINLQGQELATNGSAVFGANRIGNTNMLNLNSIPSGFTSGTTDWRGVLVNPTVNFGGTYSGNFIGYLHNPTITSIANGRHIAMQIVSGDILLNTTSGSVGIGLTGTTSPSAKLHINNTTSGNTFLAEDDTNPDFSPFVIDASGNTGIGTLTPSAKLEIKAAGTNAGTFSLKVKDFSNAVDLLSLDDTGIFRLNHPTFTGTFSIRMTANNTVVFDNSGIGNFIRFGPTNTINTLGQQIQSFDRGAAFGSSLSNPVQVPYAIQIANLPAQSTGLTSNVDALRINPSITTTGTYTGTYRGIYYNPTVSITTGTTHRAIETTTGDVLFGTTSGNVGIGTTTPTAKLHINNTTSGNTFLAEDDTNPDSTPFVIDLSGNTGIGTLTPNYKLHISGDTFIDPASYLRTNNIVPADNNQLIRFRTTNGVINGSIFLDGGTVRFKNQGSIDTINIFTDGNLGVRHVNSSGYTFDVNGTSRVMTSMRVGDNGNTFGLFTNNSIGFSRLSDGGISARLEVPISLSADRQTARVNGREGVQLAYDSFGRFQVFQSTSTIGLGAFDSALTNDTSTILRLEGTKTPSSAVARGANFVPTLSATSNNDTLIGLDINPTFQNSSFTGTTNLGLRVNSGVSSFGGNVALNNNTLHLGGNLGNTVLRTTSGGNDLQLFNNNATGNLLLNSASKITFGLNTTPANWWATFFNTGNLVIQSGGTHTDAGFKLDVIGNTRVSGDTIISSGLSASTVTITTQPTSGYTSTEILMRNSTTGQVEITDSTSPAIYNYGMSYAMTTFNYLT